MSSPLKTLAAEQMRFPLEEVQNQSNSARGEYTMIHDTAREDLVRSMKQLVAEMAKALVDSPESVSVEAETENDSSVLVLQVAPSDLGKVIGKQGRTARSIRTILGAASMKAQHRFALDIRQEGAPPRIPGTPVVPRPESEEE